MDPARTIGDDEPMTLAEALRNPLMCKVMMLHAQALIEAAKHEPRYVYLGDGVWWQAPRRWRRS